MNAHVENNRYSGRSINSLLKLAISIFTVAFRTFVYIWLTCAKTLIRRAFDFSASRCSQIIVRVQRGNLKQRFMENRAKHKMSGADLHWIENIIIAIFHCIRFSIFNVHDFMSLTYNLKGWFSRAIKILEKKCTREMPEKLIWTSFGPIIFHWKRQKGCPIVSNTFSKRCIILDDGKTVLLLLSSPRTDFCVLNVSCFWIIAFQVLVTTLYSRVTEKSVSIFSKSKPATSGPDKHVVRDFAFQYHFRWILYYISDIEQFRNGQSSKLFQLDSWVAKSFWESEKIQFLFSCKWKIIILRQRTAAWFPPLMWKKVMCVNVAMARSHGWWCSIHWHG